MQRIEADIEAGATAARRDIAAGRPQVRYGARGSWGEDLARTLSERFSVELVVPSCFMSDKTMSFDAGYNAAAEAHIDAVWGSGRSRPSTPKCSSAGTNATPGGSATPSPASP